MIGTCDFAQGFCLGDFHVFSCVGGFHCGFVGILSGGGGGVVRGGGFWKGFVSVYFCTWAIVRGVFIHAILSRGVLSEGFYRDGFYITHTPSRENL